MSPPAPVVVAARGDEWTVSHARLEDVPRYEEFDAAHNVAQQLAAELGVGVQIDHPRNVNLRKLSV